MLDSIKIRDAINALLVQKYPTRTVYIDLCPQDFERPNFLIQTIPGAPQSANAKTVRITDYFSITIQDATDDYYNSSTTDLLTDQQAVLNIFRPGFIMVEGRAVKVQASTGGRDFDKAFVDVQAEYHEDRIDPAGTPAGPPLMGEFNFKVKEE